MESREVPLPTPILDILMPTIDQFVLDKMESHETRDAYGRLLQPLINDWLTAQELEAELAKLPNEYEQKCLLLRLRINSRRFFGNALKR